jgi:DNA modification methylase
MAGSVTFHCGDAADVLATLPPGSAQCVVTSPPYYAQRDYGVAGQIGQEMTPAEYVASLRRVFTALWPVLRDDGILWLNMGDTYSTRNAHGFKRKALLGMPWRVALDLQDAGWWLRTDIIWKKPNVMPQPVRDRPTTEHEYVFMFTKAERYFWNEDAAREPAIGADRVRNDRFGGTKYREGVKHSDGSVFVQAKERNIRTVWTIPTTPYRGAHYATFPPELARRCVALGSREGDTVLDPFGGSGTVAMVSRDMCRDAVHIDIDPESESLARQRMAGRR